VNLKEGYKQTEIGVIPEDWEVTKLGEVLKIQTGKKNAEDAVENGEYPFFTRSVDTQKINTYSHDTEALFIAGEGNFAVKYYKGKFDIHQRTYMLTSIKDNNVDLKFLQNSIQPRIFRLIATSVGSTVQSLRKPIIENLKIPLPPLKEQKKIAEILSTVDEKIAFVDKSIEETQTLKKGLMQKLLIEGIGHTEFKESELGRIPKEWEVVKLEKLVNIISGQSPSNFDLSGTKYKFFKVNQLNFCTKYLTESEYAFDQEIENLLDRGTVLFPKRGASIFSNKVRIITHKSFIDTNLMGLIVKDNLNNEFLYYWLVEFELSNIADTSSVPQINNKHINPLKIQLPPLEEQKQIAEILSTTDEKLENLKAKKEAFEELKKGLMQKLLTGEIRV